MKKILIISVMFMFLLTSTILSKTWIVDQNGLGDYTSISAAINVAKPGDVVKVNPGIYNEKVVINKDILVEGSGAENTTISWQEKDWAVLITAGKIRWFSITSQGQGCLISNDGFVANCIVKDCPAEGFGCNPGAKIVNSIALRNKWGFIVFGNNGSTVVNCMSLWNTEYGFAAVWVSSTGSYDFSPSFSYEYKYCIANGNGKNNYYRNGFYALKSTGSLEEDPKFNPNSYQISSGSPCVNAGNPAYQDPDGTRADMGYYGGPDAPTFPVLRQSLIKLNEDGTIQLEAIGISPY